MNAERLFFYALTCLVGCDGSATSIGAGGGSGGCASSCSGGQGGSGGGGGSSGSGGLGGSTGGSAGSSSTTGGSGGSCPPIDDGNPCTDDVQQDACSVAHLAKDDGAICSVDGQYGKCATGNCLVGILAHPKCSKRLDVVPQGAWVATWTYFPPGASLAGAAAMIPVNGTCSTAARRIRITIPDTDPFDPSPDGVPSARELTLDVAGAFNEDGFPWVGAREDGLLPYQAGYGAWVEVEVPAGGCAAACDDDPPAIPTGFVCAGESGGSLSGCSPSPLRWIAAPLGFQLGAL